MTSTMQTPMDRTRQGSSRAFALRQPDSVGIDAEGRDVAKESDS